MTFFEILLYILSIIGLVVLGVMIIYFLSVLILSIIGRNENTNNQSNNVVRTLQVAGRTHADTNIHIHPLVSVQFLCLAAEAPCHYYNMEVIRRSIRNFEFGG